MNATNETTDPRAWIARAEEDYNLARLSLSQRKSMTYGACFHAQQCAEKYLKTVLVAKGREFPKTHDLITLVRLCEEAGTLIPVDLDLLSTLTKYAIQVRYPGADPTMEDSQEALKTVRAVRRFARKPLDLK